MGGVSAENPGAPGRRVAGSLETMRWPGRTEDMLGAGQEAAKHARGLGVTRVWVRYRPAMAAARDCGYGAWH